MNIFNRFRLKMRVRREYLPATKEFRRAALAYFTLKLAIIVLVYNYVTCQGCQETQFIRHGVHLVLFTHFVWAGMRITSTVIAVVSALRGTAYLVNFFFNTGFFLHLPITGSNMVLLHENGAGNWVFLLNALLMYAISGMIFRALSAARASSSEPMAPEIEKTEGALYGHSG